MTASPDFSSSTLTDLQKAHRERDAARDYAARLLLALGDLSPKFLAERDKRPKTGRRWANPQYNDGYRMAMEDAARSVRYLVESLAAAPVDGEQ